MYGCIYIYIYGGMQASVVHRLTALCHCFGHHLWMLSSQSELHHGWAVDEFLLRTALRATGTRGPDLGQGTLSIAATEVQITWQGRGTRYSQVLHVVEVSAGLPCSVRT